MAITGISAYNFSGDENQIQSANSKFIVWLSVTGSSLPQSFVVQFKSMADALLYTCNAIEYTAGKYFIDCNSFFKFKLSFPSMSVSVGVFTRMTYEFKMFCDTNGINQHIPLNVDIFSRQYEDASQSFNVYDTPKLTPVAFAGVPCNIGFITWSNGDCEFISPSSSPAISHTYTSSGRAGVNTVSVLFENSGTFSYQAKINYTNVVSIQVPFTLNVDVLPFPCEGVVVNYINRFGIPSYWVFEKYKEGLFNIGNQIYVDNFFDDRFNSDFRGIGSVGDTRMLKLSSGLISKKYWWCLVDLMNSPIVRLFNGGDYSNDLNYISMKVKTKKTFIDDYKKEFKSFDLELEYPKQFSVNFM